MRLPSAKVGGREMLLQWYPVLQVLVIITVLLFIWISVIK